MGDRDALIESHLPLVRAIAAEFSSFSVDGDDLFQEGCEALCRVAGVWDRSLGVRFSTFAVHRIRGAMRDLIRRAPGGIRGEPWSESWETAAEPGGVALCDIFPGDTAVTVREAVELRLLDRRITEELTPIQAAVVRLRHGLRVDGPLTFEEIARRHRKTPEAVRQNYDAGVSRLRRFSR